MNSIQIRDDRSRDLVDSAGGKQVSQGFVNIDNQIRLLTVGTFPAATCCLQPPGSLISFP